MDSIYLALRILKRPTVDDALRVREDDGFYNPLSLTPLYLLMSTPVE